MSRRVLGLAAVIGFLFTVPGVALGYWLSSDSTGPASATAGRLPAVAAPVGLAARGHTVSLRLSGPAGASYQLQRYPAGGSAPVARLACVVGRRCVEAGVPDGRWVYTAAMIRGQWRGPESTGSRPVTVDTTAPAPGISLPGPAVNQVSLVLAGPAGRAPGDAGQVTVRLYAGRVLLLVHTVPVRAGQWRLRVGPLTPQRSYTVLARQADAAGNVGSARREFVLDTVAPKLWLAPPASPARTVGGLAGDIPAGPGTSADSPTVTVQFLVAGQLVRSVQAQRAGTRFQVPTAGLTSGNYEVRAVQRDAAGNIGMSNLRGLLVDASPPAVSVQVPAYVDRSPVLTGAAGTAPGDSSRISVVVRAGGRAVLQRLVPASAGHWRLALPALPGNASYQVSVSQSDEVGNVGTASAGFVLDTVAPAPTLSFDGSALTGTAGTVPASVTSSPDQPVVTVTFCPAGGGDPVRTVTAAVAADGTFRIVLPSLPPGHYRARASQDDAAGNVGHSRPVQLRRQSAG